MPQVSDDEQAEVAYLWPCNVGTWAHWHAVQTQWRIGVGGATGLDYAGVCAYLGSAVKKRKQRDRVFEGIRAAESGTLLAWGEKAEAKRNEKG